MFTVSPPTVTESVPSTASAAVAPASAYVPFRETVIAESPFKVMTGAVVSETVTVNVPGSALLPEASCAVQVTVVAPSANVVPLAGVHSGVTDPSVASVAVAVKETVAPFAPVASTVMSLGSVRTGPTVSTVKFSFAVAVVPSVFVAVAEAKCRPSDNPVGTEMLHVPPVTVAFIGVPLSMFTVTVLPSSVIPVITVAFVAMASMERVGREELIVTVPLAVPMLPAASVAVTLTGYGPSGVSAAVTAADHVLPVTTAVYDAPFTVTETVAVESSTEPVIVGVGFAVVTEFTVTTGAVVSTAVMFAVVEAVDAGVV